MKTIIFVASLIFLISCGKVEEKKKVSQTSLQLNGIQSTGVNLGSVEQGMQKYLLVTCTNQTQATNASRLNEINNLKNSLQNGSYVNFTITGVTVSPSQMNTLLQQASQTLSMFSNYPQCPSNVLASLPVN